MARAYIGTSGFSYGHWSGTFYPDNLPQDELLGFYARHFDTVELNTTFYRLPFKNMVSGWYRRSPDNFVFALKGSRYITHRLKLKEIAGPLATFLDRAAILREKCGPILWQLPPQLNPDPARLESFLQQLPRSMRHAIEFRNDAWLTGDIFALLEKYQAAYCIVSAPEMACVPEITAPFVYIRMHGISGGWYSYNYSPDDLAWWAEKIRGFLRKKLDVYCYFNNDACGYAPANARDLKLILERGSK